MIGLSRIRLHLYSHHGLRGVSEFQLFINRSDLPSSVCFDNHRNQPLGPVPMIKWEKDQREELPRIVVLDEPRFQSNRELEIIREYTHSKVCGSGVNGIHVISF